MAGGAAVITDYEARDIYRFEVRQSETFEAAKIAIVPASIGSADQASARSVVGQDDPVVSKRSDDDRCLWARGGAGGSRRRSLQSVDLTSSSCHGAAAGRRRLRDLAFYRDSAAPGGGAATHTSSLRRRPDPVVQHVVECESDGMENRAIWRARCARADYFVCIDKQRRYRQSSSIRCSVTLRRQRI